MNKQLLITELQHLRESIGFLHNHKEQSAYSIFALIVAGASWAGTSSAKSFTLLSLLFLGACALHFMMRFQLRQRLHCAQFYRVYFAAIRRVLQMSDSEVEGMSVVTQTPELKAEVDRFSTNFISVILWSSREGLAMAARNYPVFHVVHEEITRTSDYYIREGVPTIEKVPTLGSLACIGFILYQALNSIEFKTIIASICVG